MPDAGHDRVHIMDMTIDVLGVRLVWVRFSSRLDAAAVHEVEPEFTASVGPGKNVIVDLSGVDFVSSTGIRMLLSAAQGAQARNGKLAIFGVRDCVGEVLEDAAIRDVVPICDCLADALWAVAPPL